MSYPGGISEYPALGGGAGPWQRRLRVAAIVGAAASAAIVLLSFAPVPSVPGGVWQLVFVGAIVINFPTVISFNMRARRGGIPPGELSNLLINRNRWFYLVVAVAVVSFFWGILTLHGQAEIHHGRYYLDDHGTLTQVSHATYLRAMATAQRMFASFAAVFYSVATIFNSAQPQRSGTSS